MVDTLTFNDPLGEALHLLRMRGAFYSRCELHAPWGATMPAIPDSLMFHVVLSGACQLEGVGGETRELRPGDLALVPHGAGHVLRSAAGVPAPGLFDLPREAISERFEVIQVAGRGPRTQLLCGTVFFDHPAAQHLAELLPPVIVVEGWRSAESEWIASTLRLMAAEARTPRPGGEEVITRLADILVIQAIRAWLEQAGASGPGWLTALRDPQVGRVLAMVHRDPARPWRVEQMAAGAAMSRSAFSERFTRLVGEAPMQYVSRWRMQLAMSALREEDVTLAELAQRLGYGSEASLSHAFKRWTGTAPGAVRRAAGRGGAGSSPELATKIP
ncbi:MAG: AraC family transcriptional regulator [Thermomicrobiales bacterium]